MPDSARTAIPAFVGYTETATIDGKPACLTPVRLGSLADYHAVFGGAEHRDAAAARHVVKRDASSPNAAFNLYNSVRLFYANGGGPCYVCSAGSYADGVSGIDRKKLQDGLTAVGAQAGPTLLAIPEAVLLASIGDFADIARRMLTQCATLQDRIAILDVYGADRLDPARPTYAADLEAVIARFHDAVGDTSLNYGVAYFPFLVTSEDDPCARMNLLPPSAAMAGVCAMVDSTAGVWHAPANIALNAVLQASVRIDDEQQKSINIPLDGKAINVIRDFAGRGAVVWGARTLDGNSNDFRYVHVRRTIVYIETSIKARLSDFVSAPNDDKTWKGVIERVSGFLHDLWARGGLVGGTASDAFTVACGAGSTMTGRDLLEGDMIVMVRLQLIRPGEFIELTFKQPMRA